MMGQVASRPTSPQRDTPMSRPADHIVIPHHRPQVIAIPAQLLLADGRDLGEVRVLRPNFVYEPIASALEDLGRALFCWVRGVSSSH